MPPLGSGSWTRRRSTFRGLILDDARRACDLSATNTGLQPSAEGARRGPLAVTCNLQGLFCGMRVVSTALRRPLFLGILSAASVGRHRPCRLQIFPGDSPAAVAPPSGDFDGRNPPAVTGFWTIYDDVAMEDSMNRAARQEPEGPNSMMSASIVLRADGFTSRGSEFTRGTWEVEEQGARRRLRITLEARALQEEIRYDGLLVKLDTAETGMAQALAAALPKGSASQEEAIPQTELRVVGQASRYRVGGEGFEEGSEPELMKTTAFSMIKLEVHRTTLILTLTLALTLTLPRTLTLTTHLSPFTLTRTRTLTRTLTLTRWTARRSRRRSGPSVSPSTRSRSSGSRRSSGGSTSPRRRSSRPSSPTCAPARRPTRTTGRAASTSPRRRRYSARKRLSTPRTPLRKTRRR